MSGRDGLGTRVCDPTVHVSTPAVCEVLRTDTTIAGVILLMRKEGSGSWKLTQGHSAFDAKSRVLG